MAEHDRRYQPPAIDVGDNGLSARRYGITDLQQAESRGYGAVGEDEGGNPSIEDLQAAAGYPQGASERAHYEMLLLGPPSEFRHKELTAADGSMTIRVEGGCMAQAQPQIFGSQEQYLEYLELVFHLETFSIESIDELYRSDGFVSANRAWSDCMASRGMEYATPDSASSRWAEHSDTVRSRTVAVADVERKQSVDYVARLLALEAEYEAVRADEVGPLLADYTRLADELDRQFESHD